MFKSLTVAYRLKILRNNMNWAASMHSAGEILDNILLKFLKLLVCVD